MRKKKVKLETSFGKINYPPPKLSLGSSIYRSLGGPNQLVSYGLSLTQWLTWFIVLALGLVHIYPYDQPTWM